MYYELCLPGSNKRFINKNKIGNKNSLFWTRKVKFSFSTISSDNIKIGLERIFKIVFKESIAIKEESSLLKLIINDYCKQ